MIKKIAKNLFVVTEPRFVLQVRVNEHPEIRGYSNGLHYAVTFYTWTPTGWQELIALPPVPGQPTDNEIFKIINETISNVDYNFFVTVSVLSH